jgi:hypothetical protein
MVFDIISDSENLPKWWPAVYLDLKVIQKGDNDGKNKILSVYTKGWLPYTLQWEITSINVSPQKCIEIKANGDLQGNGMWIFLPSSQGTTIIYNWSVNANKPFLKYMSFILKPIFAANHNWAMKQGLKSLELEIRRRKGEENVPQAPKPTFPHNILLAKYF